MPDARVAPWNAVRKRGTVAQQIAHYSAVGDLQSAQAGGQYAQALQLAQTIASGATSNDALPVFLLANSMSLAGSRQTDAQMQVLMRNLNARERSWQIQTTVASRMAAHDANKSETFLLGQFDYFDKVSVAWPGLISYYRDRGNLQRAQSSSRRHVRRSISKWRPDVWPRRRRRARRRTITASDTQRNCSRRCCQRTCSSSGASGAKGPSVVAEDLPCAPNTDWPAAPGNGHCPHNGNGCFSVRFRSTAAIPTADFSAR